jgi:hypothetical protein
MRKTIATASLRKGDLPPARSAWAGIAQFALTFDAVEMGSYGERAGDLANASSQSSIQELRAHLYVEQRRWNHFGEVPDAVTFARLQELLELIRSRVE